MEKGLIISNMNLMLEHTARMMTASLNFKILIQFISLKFLENGIYTIIKLWTFCTSISQGGGGGGEGVNENFSDAYFNNEYFSNEYFRFYILHILVINISVYCIFH